jgi:hypothetical protein
LPPPCHHAREVQTLSDEWRPPEQPLPVPVGETPVESQVVVDPETVRTVLILRFCPCAR